ncbi:hypothetical protein AB0L44_44615 [Nonomuraea wenchangensis]|uniref:hypothetical protein n=1 Tax=Nonomuraea wenchangensis TaxID=568860 RepID=UPI003435010D
MTPGPTTPLAIDPTLMTQLISLMKRLSQTIPETGAQVDKALGTVRLSMSGPGAARDIAHQIGTKVPELQRRLDLMLAAQKVALSRSQALWADESQWVSDTPAAGAATADRLATALRTAMKKGTIDAKTLADLQNTRTTRTSPSPSPPSYPPGSSSNCSHPSTAATPPCWAPTRKQSPSSTSSPPP